MNGVRTRGRTSNLRKCQGEEQKEAGKLGNIKWNLDFMQDFKQFDKFVISKLHLPKLLYFLDRKYFREIEIIHRDGFTYYLPEN